MTYFLILFLILLTPAVYFWGADTRDGRDWQPYDMEHRSR